MVIKSLVITLVLTIQTDSEPDPGSEGQQISGPTGSDASSHGGTQQDEVWTHSSGQRRIHAKLCPQSSVLLMVLMWSRPDHLLYNSTRSCFLCDFFLSSVCFFTCFYPQWGSRCVHVQRARIPNCTYCWGRLKGKHVIVWRSLVVSLLSFLFLWTSWINLISVCFLYLFFSVLYKVCVAGVVLIEDKNVLFRYWHRTGKLILLKKLPISSVLRECLFIL